MPEIAQKHAVSLATGLLNKLSDVLPATALTCGTVEGWSPDTSLSPSLWELFGHNDDVAADGLALAFGSQRLNADCDGPWLWVQDSASIRQSGRPYLHGLPSRLRTGLIHVSVRRATDALWAMEEGVRCSALSFVVGEIAGDPKSLDFTATRRLVLASDASGTPLYLIRRKGTANLSAARMRWSVNSAPSLPHRWNERAPGAATCQAELFRARGLKPDNFHLTHGIGSNDRSEQSGSGDHLHLVPQFHDRSMDKLHIATG